MSNRVLVRLCLVLLAAASPALRAADGKVKPIAFSVPARQTPVDFETEVLPSLNASCMACHNKAKAKAGLVLETPADIRKGGDAGPAVVPGKPGESLLVKSAAHADGDVAVMPPAGNKVNAPDLTPERLGLIALWISQGATGEVKGPAPLVWRPVPAAVRPVYAVAVSPDGTLAAAGRGTGVDLYDLKAAKRIARLADPALAANIERPDAHRDLVQSLAFSPDGKTLASGGYREVKLWSRGDTHGDRADGDGAGGEARHATTATTAVDAHWNLDRTIGTGGTDSPLEDRVNALDFSPDGERLAIGSGVPSRSGQVLIWSVKDGKVDQSLDRIHSDSVLALQFTPDGNRLVTGSADRFARLVDLGSGKVVRSFEGHTHHVLGVSIRRDGKVIATAGADNTLRFWDAETGERRKTSATFDREVTGVRYAGGGDTVVACAGDAKVKLYKDSGAEARNLPGPADFAYAVAASADGSVLVAGGQDGVLRAWGADGKASGTFAE